MKNMIIFLFIFSSFLVHTSYMLSMEETPDMYPIITLDNVEKKIPQKHLLLSEVFRNMIEDIPSNTVPLPLPIKSEMLPILTQCLENCCTLQDKTVSETAADNARKAVQQTIKTQLNTQSKLHSILTFAHQMTIPSLLEKCEQIWAEANYKPNELYSVPPPINQHIARQMKRSNCLIGNLAGWIAKDLVKNKITLYEKTLRTSDPLWSVAISHDGTLIAAGSTDGFIKIYNNNSNAAQSIDSNHPGCTRLQFNEDDSQIWSSGKDGTVKAWDLATCKNVITLRSPKHRSFTFCYIPQHKIVITDGQKHELCCWNLLKNNNTGPEIIDAHIDNIDTLEPAHDGSLFVSTSQDGLVRIWNTETKKTKAIIDDNGGNAISSSFNHKNNCLLCGSENGFISLYDIATKKQLTLMQGHIRDVWSVLFSETDTLFCSGSDDTTIKLWDTQTKLPIITLFGHSEGIQSMALSPTTNMLASSSLDKTVNLWDLRKLVNPIITLRNEFLQSSIEQIHMLEDADASKTPLRITDPHRCNLFQSFSPEARRILLENENITQ